MRKKISKQQFEESTIWNVIWNMTWLFSKIPWFAQLLIEDRLYFGSWHPTSFKTITYICIYINIYTCIYITYSRKNKYFNNNNQQHILAEYNFKIDTLEKVENV